jgi:uncharacterized lipoprotein
MKKNLIYIVIILFLGACSSSINPITKEQTLDNKRVIIDLDEELLLKESLGGLKDENIFFDEPIYIGDNDEVSFKGNILKKKSPIHIKIGKKSDIIFNQTTYRVRVSEIKSGDTIEMRDKNGKVFLSIKLFKGKKR